MDIDGQNGHRNDIEAQIQDLKEQLAKAEARLRAHTVGDGEPDDAAQTIHSRASIKLTGQHLKEQYRSQAFCVEPGLTRAFDSAHVAPANHFLLLLSDSALPLGSFAFSSGLESYLAHIPRSQSSSSSFTASFLPLSVSSYASTTLPFVLAAHRRPSRLPALDDALDAAIICTVGRRASTAQGRALLSIWERSLAPASVDGSVLRDFAGLLRGASEPSPAADEDLPPAVSAHLAPLFGVVANLLGLNVYQTAYVFVLSHVKALVSAAVRAGILGPYQAQKILASRQVQDLITAVVHREWETPVEEAGQSVPVMDLWIGRHEMLYSRIFNS